MTVEDRPARPARKATKDRWAQKVLRATKGPRDQRGPKAIQDRRDLKDQRDPKVIPDRKGRKDRKGKLESLANPKIRVVQAVDRATATARSYAMEAAR